MLICIQLFNLTMRCKQGSSVRLNMYLLWLMIMSQLVYGDNDPLSYSCPNSRYSYSLGSEFQGNLNYTLTRLLDMAPQSGFGNFTNGTGIDQVFGLYYCAGDIDHQACHSCVQSGARKIVQLCKSQKEAIVWYQDCTLHYANRSIFSRQEDTPSYPYYNYTGNVSSYILDPYRDKFESTVKGLINQVTTDDRLEGFATTQVNLSSNMSLRALVQCTPDILGAPCYTCLSTALRLMDLWANTIIFLPSCLVRFDIYGSSPVVPLVPRRHLSVGYAVLIALLSVIVVSSLLGGFWFCKRPLNSQDPSTEVTEVDGGISEDDILELSERGRAHGLTQFTYSQVEEMTNWFTRKLGEGGYGVVYYGCLPAANSREVAVKLLSKNDAPRQFSTEIDVFGRISHKNLVSLIGFCEEGTHLALIYEYMARGDLKVLLADHPDSLSWKSRLEIAIDTAQGLDYLHNGCSPPIVHRDVKPANILLNQDLRAKVADFGFSKIFPDEYVSNLLTKVVGTPGYLDPLYNLTGQLNEKGDVYSFGVVVLELITGRVAVSKFTNLVNWVRPLIECGDIDSILDSNLREDVDENCTTIWKATELAVKCVSLDASERPTMSQIVTQLKECLAMQTQPQMSTTRSPSMEMASAFIPNTLMGPTPR